MIKCGLAGWLATVCCKPLKTKATLRNGAVGRKLVVSIRGGGHFVHFLFAEPPFDDVQRLLVHVVILVVLKAFDFVQPVTLFDHLTQAVHFVQLLSSLSTDSYG